MDLLFPIEVDNLAELTKKCAYCGGKGKDGDTSCVVCGGDGYVMVKEPVKECPLCEGKGRYGGKKCSVCEGTGWDKVVG